MVLVCFLYSTTQQILYANMKTKLLIPLLLLGAVLLLLSSEAYKGKNERNKVEAFFKNITDARMMYAEEGKLAVERGTTKEIRMYGALLIKEQAILVEELQAVAFKENIELPTEISKEKKEELAALRKLRGKDFDRKFLNMMKISYRNDVRSFKQAKKFRDVDVKNFAAITLPAIENQMEKLKDIE